MRAFAVDAVHAREHLDVPPERLERLEDGRQAEPRSLGARRPVVHHHPVRDVDDPEPLDGGRRRLPQRRERRHHAVEQRQRERRAQSSQHGTTGKRLPGDDHDSDLRMRNGVLRTIPVTIGRPAVVLRRCRTGDGAHRRAVVVLRPPPERVRQEPLRQRADEQLAPLQQQRSQPRRPLELGAVGQIARRVDWPPGGARRPPLADGVVVLEGQPERVHRRVADRAGRALPVPRQPVPAPSPPRRPRRDPAGPARRPAGAGAAFRGRWSAATCRAAPATSGSDTTSR